ncbi:CD99 antigen-like protein 2 [Arapaima gigas]
MRRFGWTNPRDTSQQRRSRRSRTSPLSQDDATLVDLYSCRPVSRNQSSRISSRVNKREDTGSVGDSVVKPHGGHGGNSEPGNGTKEHHDAGSGPIAGILSGVGVTILGAATSFFAYQKKKWCFKVQAGDLERADKNIQEAQSEPQVLSNLQKTA